MHFDGVKICYGILLYICLVYVKLWYCAIMLVCCLVDDSIIEL